jgi:hypothetical protein
MAEKSCRVSVMDTDGTSHSVRVTASSVFEAAATGLAVIRNSGWANVPFEPMRISVSVNEIPVEHEGRSPREIVERNKVRLLLGIPDERQPLRAPPTK